MRYIRNSKLRQEGGTRNTINIRARARRAEASLSAERHVADNLIETINEVRRAVSSVKVPNGTTRKVARILSVGI